MTDFEPPRLHAPRLADVLGRGVPEIELVRLERQPQAEGLPLEVAAAVRAAVLPHLDQVRAGDTVAIGVGSRGIRDIPLVVAALITALRERAARPFIVPAMGSHGGADAAGQEETLRRLGVDARLGAPVRATMETVPLGRAGDVAVRFDALAATADHIIVVNRLKSHTSFSGRIESGLAKMLAIGLGKQSGAEELHRLGPTRIEDRSSPPPASSATASRSSEVLRSSRGPTSSWPRSSSCPLRGSAEPVRRSCCCWRRRMKPGSPSSKPTYWWWTRWGRSTPAREWTPTSSDGGW